MMSRRECRAAERKRSELMSKKREENRNGLARRMIAGLLSLVMLCGLLPASVLPAFAVEEPEEAEEQVSWAQDYMDKLVSWGVMRGDIDGNMYPDRDITRAEFVTMINRAYGYEDVGEIPFTDVGSRAWYADDIAIAYNVGYFAGTSETTASPEASLTREQAALLLGRNMMLQETRGETLGYSDSREFSEWSRNMMRSITNAGIIDGYPDGSFRPQKLISRGEVACMLAKAIGTPIQESGVHTLGGVYGNVTINTPGVTLRNTTIAGDLYLTGGIGLGDVLLENVKVLGRIVTSGAGESNAGDSSILLRNVQADEMIVDNISNQFVTVRAEGDTSIGVTSVRTPAYLEDVTPDGFGLKLIKLDGEEGTNLQLAGNIKEVINQTPGSRIVMAQGVAKKITVDEKATGTGLSILNGARVETVNLDVGASVSGDGDIEHLVVNAPGSTISMLPDTMTVRPGVNANIGGENMDTVAAAESSADPRLLAGYPDVRSIAPESATAVFSTNKKGTVYWALSALSDGSVSEKDLMTPPAYGGSVLQSGTIAAAASKTEYTAGLKDLVTDGSYYVTSMLVDNRGQHSPVKVAAFTTPDDTVPAFAEGYPRVSKITSTDAQVTAMTNKSCMLYYALLPKGSTAPKAADFRTGAITGNLGYGSLDMVKNSTQPFQVNSLPLEEQVTYDLYLWLTDYDNAKSSEVVKLEITTMDGTPPIIRHMDRTNATNNSITMTFSLNEPGVVFWGVVKEGNRFYTENDVDPESEWAKIYVTNGGVNSIARSGNQGVAAATAETDFNFTINNLEPETAYHIYYVARDTAGNYSEAVEDKIIRTTDGSAPTVTQEFSVPGEEFDPADPKPLSNTSIRLVFSESAKGWRQDASGQYYDDDFQALYQKVLQANTNQERAEAKDALAQALREHIQMYVASKGQPVLVTDRSDPSYEADSPWIIDYREAMVTQEVGRTDEGKEVTRMVITFPSKDDPAYSRENPKPDGLNLDSGATYFFRLINIADTSEAENKMQNQDLPRFTTQSAQVYVEEGIISRIHESELRNATDANKDPSNYVRVDFTFEIDPQNTEKSDESNTWDMLLWADMRMDFTLYSREEGETYWKREGNATIPGVSTSADGTYTYVSLTKAFHTEMNDTPRFDLLRDLNKKIEYAVHITSLKGIPESSDKATPWTDTVHMQITIGTGNQNAMQNLAQGAYERDWEAVKDKTVQPIGVPDPRTLEHKFSDEVAPEFVDNYPTIQVGDTQARITSMLDRNGYVYYVAVPVTIEDPDKRDAFFAALNGTSQGFVNAKALIDGADYTTTMLPTTLDGAGRPDLKDVPVNGQGGDADGNGELLLSKPDVRTVTDARAIPNSVWTAQPERMMYAEVEDYFYIRNLLPDTLYLLYLVTKGEGPVYSDNVYCYTFVTGEAERPTITLDGGNPNVSVHVDRNSYVSYLLVINNTNKDPLDLHKKLLADDGTSNTSYTLNEEGLKNAGTMTVLDALTKPASGISYFDQYVTEEGKRTLESRIRLESGGGNSVTMDGGHEKDVEFTDGKEGSDLTQVISEYANNLDPLEEYIFLATAYTQVGSGPSFRALRPVIRVDNEAPKVKSIITSNANPDKVTNVLADAIKLTWSGTVTVEFDEDLFYKLTDGANPRILPISREGDVNSSELSSMESEELAKLEWVKLGWVTTTSHAGEVTILGPEEQQTNIISFEFTDIPRNVPISIGNGRLCDEGGNTRGVFQIMLMLTVDEFGYYAPKFTLNNDTWKADDYYEIPATRIVAVS